MEHNQLILNTNMETRSYNLTSGSNFSGPIEEDGYDSIMSVAYAINRSYLWIVLAFGFPGNAAAIFTIFRMRHLGSFAFYVVLLAVVDTLALIFKILNYQLVAENVTIYAAGCKFLSFLANFLISYANWILVLMASERLLAVKFPLKVQSFNLRNSVIAALIVGILLAIPYLPVLWIISFDDRIGCIVDTTNSSLLAFLYWAHRFLYGFIPFLVLMISNMFIARVIRNSFRLRHALRNIGRVSSLTPVPDTSIQRQIMVMLFTTTFVFVLFTFPICAYNVAEIYWHVQVKTKEDAIKYLLKQIAYVMCDSNHAVNFYLYFFSARKFRSQFIRHSVFYSSQRGRATPRL